MLDRTQKFVPVVRPEPPVEDRPKATTFIPIRPGLKLPLEDVQLLIVGTAFGTTQTPREREAYWSLLAKLELPDPDSRQVRF